MNYTPLLLTLAVVLTVFFACEPNVPDEPEVTSGFKSDMLAQVNELRRSGCRCGAVDYPPVEPLSWNRLLEEAALRHSTDMQVNDIFDHQGSDGSNFGDRVTDTGYRWRAVAENIAGGYSTVDEVVDGWLKSEGHCKNLMGAEFTEMGAARKGTLWTQTFAAPL
ncbi:MAG: CAP domain-containing protein [Saprospiraceae bacterium]